MGNRDCGWNDRTSFPAPFGCWKAFLTASVEANITTSGPAAAMSCLREAMLSKEEVEGGN